MTSREGKGTGSLAHQLTELLAPSVQALGYDLIDLEFQNKSPQGGAIVRLFIDYLQPSQEKVGIEDCVRVDRGVSEKLESPDFEELLPEQFTLEVSSPGVDRPLTRPEHFQQFVGRKTRIKTYRPLTREEIGNDTYFAHHETQKNFGGELNGLENGNVLLTVDGEQIRIPYTQVAKAHLDVADDLLNAEEFLDLKNKHKAKANKKR